MLPGFRAMTVDKFVTHTVNIVRNILKVTDTADYS